MWKGERRSKTKGGYFILVTEQQTISKRFKLKGSTSGAQWISMIGSFHNCGEASERASSVHLCMLGTRSWSPWYICYMGHSMPSDPTPPKCPLLPALHILPCIFIATPGYFWQEVIRPMVYLLYAIYTPSDPTPPTCHLHSALHILPCIFIVNSRHFKQHIMRSMVIFISCRWLSCWCSFFCCNCCCCSSVRLLTI